MSKNEPVLYQSSRESEGVYAILDASHIDIYLFFYSGIEFFQHSRSHFKIMYSGNVAKKHVSH
jgi:hypothetical protein